MKLFAKRVKSKLRSVLPVKTEKELTESDFESYYLYQHLPSRVRLEASTICQLRCTGCSFQTRRNDNLGRGFLSIENFRRFAEMNPFVHQIELSNWGELFLNPDLVEIMHEAQARDITLTAYNGSNFNTVSEAQLRAMVDTKFKALSISIDGASQETHAKYRIGGDFDKVIENLKKLQRYKEAAGSDLPKIKWQYVLMEHNELEVGKAKKLAKELDIPITFKLNWDNSYHPIEREFLLDQTGLAELTRAEYSERHGVPYLGSICQQMFVSPQINWDGRLLGCCNATHASFDVNVFEVGLQEALKSPEFLKAKKCLFEVNPDETEFGSCMCFDCPTRRERESAGMKLKLKSPKQT